MDEMRLSTSTPLGSKRTRISLPDDQRPRKSIKANVASFGSRSTPIPVPRAVILRVSQQWHDCIRACADSKGFDGERLVKVVQQAPESQSLTMVLRVLQLMCEVANEGLLLRLRDALLAGKNDLAIDHSGDPSCNTLATRFWKTHDLVVVCPHKSQFFAWLAQMYYFEEFQEVCKDASQKLDKARREREKQKRWRSQGKVLETYANASLGYLDNYQGSAEERVKSEVCRILGGKNYWMLLNGYINQGRTLHGLLSFDGGDRGNPFWLFLLPLYEHSQLFDPLTPPRPPLLDIMNYQAPKEYDKLRKPITSSE